MSASDRRDTSALAASLTRWSPLLFPLVACALYMGSFDAPFVFDDLDGIVANPAITRLWPPSEVVAAPPDTTPWGRPVVAYSLALNHALGGLEVLGYRLFNLGLHVANALLLLALLRRLFARAPALAREQEAADGLAVSVALLWLLHPLATSVASYTIQRAEGLAAFGMLGCLLASARAFDAEGTARWRAQLLAGLAACFAVASKESAVVLPALIVLLDVGLWRSTLLGTLRRRAGLLACVASSWLLLALLMTSWPRSSSVGGVLGSGENFVLQWRVIWHGLSLSVLTDRLVLDQHWQRVSLADSWAAGVSLTLVGGTALLGWLRQRGAWCVAVLAVFVLLAPTSSFVPIQTSPGADHRMYLPLAALLTLFVVGAWRLSARAAAARWAPVALGLLAAWWGLQTVQRNEVYLDEISLWRDVTAKQPLNSRAWNNLGSHLESAGDADAARRAYDAALQANPRNADALCNLGLMLAKGGELARGRELIEQSLSIDASNVDVHYSLGLVAFEQRDLSGAQLAYDAALTLVPEHVPSLRNKAFLFLLEGRLDEALQCIDRALLRSPQDAPSLALRVDIVKARVAR